MSTQNWWRALTLLLLVGAVGTVREAWYGAGYGSVIATGILTIGAVLAHDRSEPIQHDHDQHTEAA